MSHRALIPLLALFLALTTFSSPGQDDDASPPPLQGSDEEIAFAIWDDALQAIEKYSQKGETRAEIMRKAANGLVAELTEIYQDLPPIPAGNDTDAVRAAFHEQLRYLATYPGQRYGIQELVELAIGAYCRTVDRYSHYFTRKDYDAHVLSRKSSGAGVGMTLQESTGEYFCYPYPGGSAEAAGIHAGDMLLAVDGDSIKGQSLLTLAAKIRGTPGTEVTLKISRTYGRSTNIKLLREELTVPAVVVEESYAGLVFKLRKITPQTVEDMTKAMMRAGEINSLTLDLRGCPGGEITAAKEFAALFLPRGSTVFEQEILGERTKIKSESEPIFHPARIIIIQDAGTASAAEILIAALFENMPDRVVTQGEKSFGKGVIQEAVRLAGGGFLEITTGRVYSPKGHFWDGIGLQPSLTNNGSIFGSGESSGAPPPDAGGTGSNASTFENPSQPPSESGPVSTPAVMEPSIPKF